MLSDDMSAIIKGLGQFINGETWNFMAQAIVSYRKHKTRGKLKILLANLPLGVVVGMDKIEKMSEGDLPEYKEIVESLKNRNLLKEGEYGS